MSLLHHNFHFPGQLSQAVFPDLQLTTNHAAPDDFIPAHRVVVSAVSEKLRNMCKAGGKVVIRNIEFKVLKDVVKFIYEGNIEMKCIEDIYNLRDGLDMLKIEIGNVKGLTKEDMEGESTNDKKNTNRNHNTYDSQMETNVNSFSEVTEAMSNLIENVPSLEAINKSNHIEVPSVNSNLVAEEDAWIQDDEYKFKDIAKSQTKVPCDYCEEKVTLARYVSHCKKFHSIRTENHEECKIKCLQCGARVHIVARKFHDQIYHPDYKFKPCAKKPQFLNVLEHKKSLTRIVCDFCNDSLCFKFYRKHVKNQHPEINFKERVKCGKCGSNVFKFAFYYHGMIFHKSAEVKSYPTTDLTPSTRSILKME